MQRAGKQNRRSRTGKTKENTDNKANYYDGAQTYGNKQKEDALPKYIVIGVVGYVAVAGIACACAQKGAEACKNISYVLCCCYYLPKCLCDLKKKETEDEEEDLQTAGMAKARDVRPTKFKKKSDDEEKAVSISRPGEN